MIRARLALMAIIALGFSTPAEAGFWGDLKRSFGTAVDNAGHDGEKAADAVGDAAGDAADAVSDGAESAVDYVDGDTGSTGNATPQHVDNTEQPVTNNPDQLSTQPEQQP
jgi:hypothetical protein